MTLKVRPAKQAWLWAIPVGGALFGAVGVIHLYAYLTQHPGPLVPPIELTAFLGLLAIPEVLRMRRYAIKADGVVLWVTDGDGQRSCNQRAVASMQVRSTHDLAPRRQDGWRLAFLDKEGAKLLEVRAAHLFGGKSVRALAEMLRVPLDVQPPLDLGQTPTAERPR